MLGPPSFSQVFLPPSLISPVGTPLQSDYLTIIRQRRGDYR